MSPADLTSAPDAAPWVSALLACVEKTALLRESIAKQGDGERYAARVDRVAQTIETLAASLETTEPTVAAAVRSAWARPLRSLAFRNAAHQTDRD